MHADTNIDIQATHTDTSEALTHTHTHTTYLTCRAAFPAECLSPTWQFQRKRIQLKYTAHHADFTKGGGGWQNGITAALVTDPPMSDWTLSTELSFAVACARLQIFFF